MVVLFRDRIFFRLYVSKKHRRRHIKIASCLMLRVIGLHTMWLCIQVERGNLSLCQWQLLMQQEQGLLQELKTLSFHWHCRMWRFLAILRSFFHSSLLCTLFFHPYSPTSHPSSLTSSAIYFLVFLSALFQNSYIILFFGILFSSILCTCPNQCNIFNPIVSLIVGFFNHCINFFIG